MKSKKCLSALGMATVAVLLGCNENSDKPAPNVGAPFSGFIPPHEDSVLSLDIAPRVINGQVLVEKDPSVSLDGLRIQAAGYDPSLLKVTVNKTTGAFSLSLPVSPKRPVDKVTLIFSSPLFRPMVAPDIALAPAGEVTQAGDIVLTPLPCCP